MFTGGGLIDCPKGSDPLATERFQGVFVFAGEGQTPFRTGTKCRLKPVCKLRGKYTALVSLKQSARTRKFAKGRREFTAGFEYQVAATSDLWNEILNRSYSEKH